jgi:hypothetical protein
MDTKKIMEALGKPLKDKTTTTAIKRLQEVLGLNFDLITDVQVLEKGFLVSVSITISDGTKKIATRKAISLDADMAHAKEQAFQEACSLLGVGDENAVATQQPQTTEKNLVSVEIASAWSTLQNGQVYCGVWDSPYAKENGIKSVLVLGGKAQEKIVQAGYSVSQITTAYTPGKTFCCYAEKRNNDSITEYVVQNIHTKERKVG